MEDREQTTAEIRSHLLSRLDEWEAGLPADGAFMGTLGAGVTQRAMSLVGTLLSRAVAGLTPEAKLRVNPTWRTYIDALKSFGSIHRLSCSGEDRVLVTDDEIKLMDQLKDYRNRFAHPEEAETSDPADIGTLDSGTVRDILQCCRHVVALPVFDELICREGGSE